MAKQPEDRYQTPAAVCEALQPFVRTAIEAPPEDEMPVLSPAAREPSSAHATPGSGSGAFREDSTVLRAERPAPMASSVASMPPPTAARKSPMAVAAPPGQKPGLVQPSGNGSSGNMPLPYFEPPPMVSPLGSAAVPPVPNPTRPVNETARMAEETDRAARRPSPRRPLPVAQEVAGEKRRWNPVVKIVIESIVVFGLCLVLYFILRGLS